MYYMNIYIKTHIKYNKNLYSINSHYFNCDYKCYNCDNKEVDKSKLHFICKFSRLGLRLDNDIPDDIRDKVMFLLKANKGMMDKTIRDVIFNKEVVINEYDYEVMRLIIFAFLFKLSEMNHYFIDGDDFYVY